MEIAKIMKTRSMAKDLSGTVREKLSVVCAINDEDSNNFQQEITDDDVEGMDELVHGGNLRRTSGLCSCSKDMKYKSGDECFLDVGDNNEIREHASIHRSSKSSDTTVIGNNNLIMGSCHIAHDCKVGNNVIFANNTLLAGHVVVEDYAHTAGAVVVHQFCHVGSFAFIGGGSVIAQDVPKYMMVAGERAQLRGLNLEGLRRHGFTVAEIRSLRTAYQRIFMPADANSSGFEARLAEVELHDKLAHIPAVCSMVQSIRDSFKEKRRGLCKFRHWNSS